MIFYSACLLYRIKCLVSIFLFNIVKYRLQKSTYFFTAAKYIKIQYDLKEVVLVIDL